MWWVEKVRGLRDGDCKEKGAGTLTILRYFEARVALQFQDEERMKTDGKD